MPAFGAGWLYPALGAVCLDPAVGAGHRTLAVTSCCLTPAVSVQRARPRMLPGRILGMMSPCSLWAGSPTTGVTFLPGAHGRQAPWGATSPSLGAGARVSAHGAIRVSATGSAGAWLSIASTAISANDS